MVANSFEHIELIETGIAIIVKITTRELVDNFEIEDFGKELLSLSFSKEVVIDLSDVDRLDNHAIGKLVALKKGLKATRHGLTIYCPKPSVKKRFEDLTLTSFFTITSTLEQTLEKIRKAT
jgi:anti-anti-sigma regulatory factor